MGIYKIKKGDRDCSASVIDALKTAGIPTGAASYTGNMRSEFLKTGVWEWHNMSYTAHRGDVYLAAGHHTAMCSAPLPGRTSPDMLLEFSHNESGGYYNGRVGDQLNNSANGESHKRAYYSYPWDGILHYIGPRKDLLEDAVQLMEHLVSCPEHGYTMSSPGRNGSSGYCTVETTGTPTKKPFTGWDLGPDGWIYYENDKQVFTGWKKIKGEWYYFEEGVAVQERLIEWKGHKYYLETNCDMLTGWVFLYGSWRYFRPKNDGQPLGSMVTGQYTINGKKYNFDSEGKLIK